MVGYEWIYKGRGLRVVGGEGMKYSEFLESKRIVVTPVGVDVPASSINPMLYEFQRDIVAWALRRGRAAMFCDCGLGKTPMQLEWARHIPGRVLTLAPLAVAEQTCREGAKFGVQVEHQREQRETDCRIIVTNYERLHHFKPDGFAGIVLDESSILKGFDGSTRKQIQEFAKGIKYRLACTATPAPNDLIELTNHAEFLDVMSGKEIIALFFKQDGNTTHQWRLKGHAREAFWRWLAQWSVAMRKPSDLGFEDGAFALPPLNMHPIIVDGITPDGFLFPIQASTMDERRCARRGSMTARVDRCAELVNADPSATWLVWCDLNAEGEALRKAIPGSVEVKGSDSVEHKETSMRDFSLGKIRVLISKPSLCGHGMNWQHCQNVAFVGLSDSYEQFYQAIRRCWRFGQKRPVNCYVITADAEGAVVSNIQRKERQAQEMFDALVREMSVYEAVSHKSARGEMDYNPTVPMRLPEWLKEDVA